MNTDRNLKLALAQLARSSKTGWDQFLKEYRAHCDDLSTQLISSPRDTLEVAQGRARHARELLQVFETCLRDADQIHKGQN